MVQALLHGLFVGGYYFGYATSIPDAQKEADVCNEILQSYRGKLLFPIAYDYEYDSYNYFVRTIGRAPTNVEIDSFANAFLDRLKSYGWFVNIYTNCDFIHSDKFNTATVKKYDVWLADYSAAPGGNFIVKDNIFKGWIMPTITNCSKWYIEDNIGWIANSGATAARPSPTPLVGTPFYDETLSKPIWWNGTVWKDADGVTVYICHLMWYNLKK